MNNPISRLDQVQKKPCRLILGLMSGTSLDGLDIALCSFEGYGMDTCVSLKQFKTQSYAKDFKDRIRAVFSKRTVDLEQLTILNALIGRKHAQLINQTLSEWGVRSDEVDLIASHGQTIYHAPAHLHKISGMPNATFQIGDADHIAVITGIITVSDFRQKHIAAGGEGAPLAAYGDRLLFSSKQENRVLLNIGGIANFSFIPVKNLEKDFISTDAGPGNTLMDAFARHQFNIAYDKDSAIGRSGRVNSKLLKALLDHPFFSSPLPRTTGPELFNLEYLFQAQQKSATTELSNEDIMAVLNRFSAEAIAQTVQSAVNGAEKFSIYASGGGIHNQLLLENLKDKFPAVDIKSTDALGVKPDAKEAVLFAALANECIAPEGTVFSGKGMPDIRMGKISFPC